jgi:hypothetical protein
VTSPYAGKRVTQWPTVTKRLVSRHPLRLPLLRTVALEAWRLVWATRIGRGRSSLALVDIDPPAQIVGHFFEKMVAHLLAERYPRTWKGGTQKGEKDLVCLSDERFSIESGQLGLKVFGNRSYAQENTNGQASVRLAKSGYFLTANFHGTALSLLRFGWIDHSDWRAQTSPTGQMAGLGSDVYRRKLIPIPGDYRLDAPVGILTGVGPAKTSSLATAGIRSLRDLMGYDGDVKWIANLKGGAEQFQWGA